jgi:1-aminocyclopropane-1-carboxylate deaminase
LLEAKQLGYKTILSFGGAYSNHIHALAAAGNVFGLKTIGIIRGNELNENSNSTLKYAFENGMNLIFVDRNAYLDKIKLAKLYGKEAYILPEGGTNELAYIGIGELMNEIKEQILPTHICVAMGTGGTFGGLLLANKINTELIGISVLKGYEKLTDFLPDFPINKLVGENYRIFNDYHFGGYGKYNKVLLDFIQTFENEHNIPIEQTYTGKLLFGIYDLIEKNHFQPGSKIVIIHTGGLQGKIK